jgi:RNA ligase
VPDWPGPVVETFGHAMFAEALAAPPRPGREGLVVHVTGTDTRLKIKYDEYVRLHRLVTGLNARVVWEHLVAGKDLAELVKPLPDEFHPWVHGVADRLHAEVATAAAAVERAYASIVDALPAGWGRKEFALRAAGHPERGCLFLRLDGRDYRPLLWQRVRPTADATPTTP